MIKREQSKLVCYAERENSRMRSNIYYYYLASLANGGAQQNLNAQQIKEFETPFPSLEEQKRIAELLSSLDDKNRTEPSGK
ncbi:MAG: restriction endonuclease subunit S [Prevotella sp.]|nr:restriction endonuclease subunit S [Prevotella sp.]